MTRPVDNPVDSWGYLAPTVDALRDSRSGLWKPVDKRAVPPQGLNLLTCGDTISCTIHSSYNDYKSFTRE
jgi:hypothetical protein